MLKKENIDIHQSKKWGKFQQKVPYRGKYIYLEETENGETVSAILIRMKIYRFFSFYACTMGPILSKNNQLNQKLIEKIYKQALLDKVTYVQFQFPVEKKETEKHALYKVSLNKFVKQTTFQSFYPQTTLKIDLSIDNEDILKQMKPKGRYNIKVAKKHGVEIKEININKDKELFNDFYKILKNTALKDGFGVHPYYYYSFMLKALEGNIKLFGAFIEKRLIAGAIMTYYGNTATYFFGASSYSDRKYMAPYLLQWHAICDAKENKYKEYDFLGIAEENSINHRLKGVTSFKKKFGGEVVEYVSPIDLKISAWKYFLCWMICKIKELKNKIT